MDLKGTLDLVKKCDDIDFIRKNIKIIQYKLQECAQAESSKEINLRYFFDTNNIIFHTNTNISWGIPYVDTIKQLAKFIGKQTVLEVYAGLGIWSWLLQEEGINVIATDKDPLSNFECHKSTVTNVENLTSLDAVIKYPSDILLMCWPPPYTNSDSMDYECLINFKGNYLIFIGEINGCTGSEKLMKEINDSWIQVADIKISYWHLPMSNYNDDVYLFERKLIN